MSGPSRPTPVDHVTPGALRLSTPDLARLAYQVACECYVRALSSDCPPAALDGPRAAWRRARRVLTLAEDWERAGVTCTEGDRGGSAGAPTSLPLSRARATLDPPGVPHAG